MPDTTAVVIQCIIFVECLTVFTGNTFTIFVFWKHRNKLKRTSFLLINLAVADLLVGFFQIILTGAFYIPYHIQTNSNRSDVGNLYISASLSSLQITFTYASILLLVLISLERAYALIWPLRHRVASIKGYIYSAVFVWVSAIALGTMSLLAVYVDILAFSPWMATLCCIAALSLIVICACYMAIRAKLTRSVPAFVTVDSRDNLLEQNRKLSRTLFIVIAASLVCWGPSTAAYFIFLFCMECYPLSVIYSFNIFHLANSLVNPIIYSFKIPMFRKALRRMRLRKTSKQYRVNSRGVRVPSSWRNSGK